MKCGLLLVLVSVVYALVANGDTCISIVPSLSKDSNCMGGVSCKYGLYCDVNAKCSEVVAVGGTCNSDVPGMCITGTTCKGPKGSQTCIQNANPGQACNTTTASSVPNCGSGLYCNFFSNVCSGGQLGDACGNSTDCLMHNCTSGVCTATPNGATCSGVGQSTCAPSSYCNINLICVPKIGAGGICSSILPCADGLYCLGLTASDQTVCVANQTRLPGEYCGSFDEMCKDSRQCKNTYCAKSAADDCTSDSVCNPAQVCTCNGIALDAGYGKCTNNVCGQKWTDLSTCLWQKCGISDAFSNQMTYPGSCYNLNCKTQAAAYLECSSAFKAVPSLLLVTLIAIFISKFF